MTVDQPLISVIIPVYNVEMFLRGCIDSVINQTYRNLEILLIDDGSTDSSAEICDEYVSVDYRIKCFHRKNSGVSSARNYGIEQATGNFIVFVDGDDAVHCQMIDKLYIALCSGADLAMCACRYIRDDQTETTEETVQENKFIAREELLDDLYYLKRPCPNAEITAVWGKLYLRSLIGNIRFDPLMSVGEDFLFNYCYMTQIDHAEVMSYKGYDYRINRKGVMHSVFDEKKYQTFERIKEVTAKRQSDLGFVSRMVNIAIVLLLMVQSSDQDFYLTEITNFIKQYRRRILFNSKARFKVRASLFLSYGGFENMMRLYRRVDQLNNKRGGVQKYCSLTASIRIIKEINDSERICHAARCFSA